MPRAVKSRILKEYSCRPATAVEHRRRKITMEICAAIRSAGLVRHLFGLAMRPPGRKMENKNQSPSSRLDPMTAPVHYNGRSLFSFQRFQIRQDRRQIPGRLFGEEPFGHDALIALAALL